MAVYLKESKLLKDWKKSKENNECSRELLDDFFILSKNIYTMIGTCYDQDRDACINYAAEKAWEKWKKYDPSKQTNIFAFFTSMISNDIKIHYNKLNNKGKKMISLSAFRNI